MEQKKNLQNGEEVSKTLQNKEDTQKIGNINLFSLSVVRRDGSITPIKSDKI